MRRLYTRLIWSSILAAGVTSGICQNPDTTATLAPPNIVLIFADDLGYGDLSCYGQTKYKTPALDQMAAEGVRLTDFYVTAGACSPSRASILTGQYPLRSGVPRVLSPQSMTGLHDKAPLLPMVLKSKGYATAIVGKWHLGHLPGMMPLQRGFDQFFGLPYSNDMKPAPLFRDNVIIEANAKQDTLTQRYTGEALAFIDKSAKAGKPFFLYFAHTFPHIPLHVSEKFKGASGSGLYGDVITELDWSVGSILRHLREKNLANNTLVIFTSDNGPWTVKGDQAGDTGGLRGTKGTDYEGGIRVPFIAWWPGKLPAGKVIKEPAITTDMMPTLAKLASVTSSTIPTLAKLADPNLPEAKYDGVDIWPLLEEGKEPEERPLFFSDYYLQNPVGAVRMGDYKILFARDKTEKHDARTTQLYNLKDDPFEKNNLVERHPEKIKDFTAKADAMRAELIASNPWGDDVNRRSKEALKYVTRDEE